MNTCQLGFYTIDALESKWGSKAIIRDRNGIFFSVVLYPDSQVFSESSSISSNVELPSNDFIKKRSYAELLDGSFISVIEQREIIQCQNLKIKILDGKFKQPEWTFIERHLSNCLRNQNVAFVNGTILTLPSINGKVLRLELESSSRMSKFFVITPTTKFSFVHANYANDVILYPSFVECMEKLKTYVNFSVFGEAEKPKLVLFGPKIVKQKNENIHPKGCILCGAEGSCRRYLTKALTDSIDFRFMEINAEDLDSTQVTFYKLTERIEPKTIVLLRNFDMHFTGENTQFEQRIVSQLGYLIDNSQQVFFIMTAISKDTIPNFLLSPTRLSFYMVIPPLSLKDIKFIFGDKFTKEILDFSVGLSTKQIIRYKNDGEITCEQKNLIKGTVAQTFWDDIGGLSETKKAVREAVEWPLIKKNDFRRFGIRPPRGVLLYGPPGCGKTMIARAIATTLSSSFFSISGASVFQMYLGESERVIRELFSLASQKAPSVIFIDEIDAMVGKRGKVTGVSERVLSTFLNEMDGITSLTDVIVVAATNRIDALDDALCRPGRFDALIEVKPTQNINDIKEILTVCTRKMPLEEDVINEVSKIIQIGSTGAEIDNYCREAALLALKEGKTVVSVKHFQSIINKYRK